MRTMRTHAALCFGILCAACASTPETIPEVDAARAALSEVKSSPRAGVAATNIAEAQRALDSATQLMSKGGDLDEIQFQAVRAQRNADIASEKIATANANDAVAKGQVERQQVMIEARNREADAQREKAQRMEQELKELQAKQTDRGMLLTLGDVLFDTGKTTLKAGAYSTIDKVANVLNEDRGRTVLIEGHTDSVGSEEHNRALSLERARSVQSALMQRGVAASQITLDGRGESVPVASNESGSGRQQNRRVELVFAQQGGRVASDGT